MRESPRLRRLRADLRAMEQLRSDSTILDFDIPGPMHGGPPETYLIRFHGEGLWRADGDTDVLIRERHEVSIQLGASYPRSMPELQWRTPIFHPNISGSGIVCLGGYGTHWVPSLNLDELCAMLWDMIRYENFDIESPYNREAAIWAKTHAGFSLPLDSRPIRDRVAGQAPTERKPPITTAPHSESEVMFLDNVHGIVVADVVEAEVVEPEDPDIMFIE